MSKAHPLWKPVHDILWSEWDPIGVHSMVEGDAQYDDEYDHYVWPIVQRLASGEGVDRIVLYLEQVRTKSMGLEPYREKDTVIARKLLGLVERVRQP